jgi:hypothetical protein
MNLYNIAAAATHHLFGRLLRRALLALIMAAFAIVAIYYFTAAGTLALETRYGGLLAQLIVAAIYTTLAAITLTILWSKGRNRTTANTPVLNHQREMQLAILLEAAMLGYSLARKGERAR